MRSALFNIRTSYSRLSTANSLLLTNVIWYSFDFFFDYLVLFLWLLLLKLGAKMYRRKEPHPFDHDVMTFLVIDTATEKFCAPIFPNSIKWKKIRRIKWQKSVQSYGLKHCKMWSFNEIIDVWTFEMLRTLCKQLGTQQEVLVSNLFL